MGRSTPTSRRVTKYLRAEGDEHVRLRMPSALYGRVAQAAARSGRTVHGMVLVLLKESWQDVTANTRPACDEALVLALPPDLYDDIGMRAGAIGISRPELI